MDHKEKFQRMATGLIVFETFSQFSTEFWFLPVFVIVFKHKTYCDVLLIMYA